MLKTKNRFTVKDQFFRPLFHVSSVLRMDAPLPMSEEIAGMVQAELLAVKRLALSQGSCCSGAPHLEQNAGLSLTDSR